MTTAYILVGISGAGKTTYSHTKLKQALYLGTDDIRKELFGKELTLQGRRRVRELLYNRALDALRSGHDVVIDCTNITVKRRRKLLSHISSGHRCVAIYLATPFWLALENNQKRNRHVPTIGILSMYLRLQKPKLSEGFDKIIEVIPGKLKKRN